MITNMERVARSTLLMRQRPCWVLSPANEYNELLAQSLDESGTKLRKGTMLARLGNEEYDQLRSDAGLLGVGWGSVYQSQRDALVTVTRIEDLANAFVRYEQVMRPNPPLLAAWFVGDVMRTLEACDELVAEDGEPVKNPALQLAKIERNPSLRSRLWPIEEEHMQQCERLCRDVWQFRATISLDELKCALLLEDDLGARSIETLNHQVSLAP